MSAGKLLKIEAPKNEKLRRPNSKFIFGSSNFYLTSQETMALA